jgi:hypothetical protein
MGCIISAQTPLLYLYDLYGYAYIVAYLDDSPLPSPYSSSSPPADFLQPGQGLSHTPPDTPIFLTRVGHYVSVAIFLTRVGQRVSVAQNIP